MVFTTVQYIAFFAVVFFAYWAAPSRFRWMLLLAASLFFYAYATPYYLIFLGLTTVATYLAAVGMDENLKRQEEWIKANGKSASRDEKKAYKKCMENRRKWMVVVVAVVTIGMLVVFKYLEFLFANVNWLFGAIGLGGKLPMVKLMLPIGLSFYVFQSLGYCIDVQREMVQAERNFFRHALFVSYFPQILQGPIGDYGRLAPQFFEEHRFSYDEAVFGIQRVAWGFFKKVMIANIIADRIDPVWGSAGDYHGLIFWSLVLFLYSVQLYADFSGYMDIACGCSQMLGIKFDENFRCPYFAKSIAEFWRKWHITLGVWFKNYVFYPLLRGEVLTKLRKRLKGHDWLVNTLPTVIALFIVWLLIGLWHGADWSYVLYGLFHGSFIMLAIAMAPIYDRLHERFPKLCASKFYIFFQMFRTFMIVMIGYAIFKPAKLSATWHIVRQLFITFDGDGITALIHMLHLNSWPMFVSMFMMFVVDVCHFNTNDSFLRARIHSSPAVVRWMLYTFVLCFMALYGLYGAGFDKFEYFKF